MQEDDGLEMNKAMQLSKSLEQLDMAEGMKLIDKSNLEALYFDVIEDVMCIMHKDGSVNILENMGNGAITCEVISPEDILKVLQHYRPFKEIFKSNVQ